WSAETAFNVIKNSFGLTQAWEQTKRTFARWRCILCLVYGVCAMASFLREQDLAGLFPIPWRKNHPMTASWTMKVFDSIFRHFPIRSCWDLKLQKFVLPKSLLDPPYEKTG
ncbi:MAG: hypothetical protein LBD04_05050, partial [Synergistaceae bacterium]|nr:hypothetical protein [Synergistaceae bacterium]